MTVHRHMSSHFCLSKGKYTLWVARHVTPRLTPYNSHIYRLIYGTWPYYGEVGRALLSDKRTLVRNIWWMTIYVLPSVLESNFQWTSTITLQLIDLLWQHPCSWQAKNNNQRRLRRADSSSVLPCHWSLMWTFNPLTPLSAHLISCSTTPCV